jgi:hypothetical protein
MEEVIRSATTTAEQKGEDVKGTYSVESIKAHDIKWDYLGTWRTLSMPRSSER